jgi:sigma-E factor negative regulatory protein RseA
MREQDKESLSALFDGEANELEMRRVLSSYSIDECSQWQRFQWIRDAAKNKLAESDMSISIVDKVALRIAEEPELKSFSMDNEKSGWLKPLLGFATAASVAFVTVLGVQQFNQTTLGVESGFHANGNVSVSQLPITGNLGLNAVSGSIKTPNLHNEIDVIEAQKQREKARLKYYIQQHTQNASFNNGRGLLPMARISQQED